MFWLGLSMPIAYIPNFTGRDILSGWIVLSLALPWFFLRPIRLGIGHYLGLAFLAYAALSMCWTEIKPQGVWDLWIYLCLAGCFCLGASRDPRSLYLGCAVGVGVSTLLAIPQALGWQGIYQISSGLPAGLFVNRDMFGEAAALVSIALICTRQYWPLVLTLPPILFTGCRSAQLAVFVVASLWLWQRYRQLSIPVVAIALIGVIGWHHGWDGSESLRLAMWRDTIDGFTWFGRGPGSFFSLYPEFATRTDTMFTRPEDPHNDYLGLAFQFGLGAIPLLALLALAATSAALERYLLLAFCIIALVSFPYRMPVEGFLGMVALGRCLDPTTWPGSIGVRFRSSAYAWRLRLSGQGLPLEPVHSHHSRVYGVGARRVA